MENKIIMAFLKRSDRKAQSLQDRILINAKILYFVQPDGFRNRNKLFTII
jgi:hypothetical protein